MSELHEVEQPIINEAYEEPARHWLVIPGERPRLRDGRRDACYYYRPPGARAAADASEAGARLPLELANRIRSQVRCWREAGYPGSTRVTLDLLAHWTNPERQQRLFFCQREAAESVIFLVEARADFRQGIQVPADDPGPDAQAAGYRAFRRLACKMATGSGKTTVMAMLAAWSILNKVADRTDRRFSDAVLVVCPNITIRERLHELDPQLGEGSLYRTRDLVPPHLMGELQQGRVGATNWHNFNPQDMNRVGQDSARVVKRGEESDAALVRRVFSEVEGGALGEKRNILVLNDEAHHAYRRGPLGNGSAPGGDDSDEEAERRNREATVWIGGLDKVHRQRGINFCVDLSATPFYLPGTGNDPGRPFPWVVSDFGLIDAIESGIVKIPQLPVQDTTGEVIPAYFNIWKWVVGQLTPAERGGRRGQVKPEAVLRHAQHPLAQLAGLWGQTFRQWQEDAAAGRRDPVPPTFIVICRDTQLAKTVHAWLASGDALAEFANVPGAPEHTVRIDSRVVEDLETGVARDDESQRLRYVLGTVGCMTWREGAPPREWQDLVARWNARARDRGEPLLDAATPPGRDVRCIVSVAMLTEGWDASNVTHIAGLRPFDSQLLCEQVVGRGLRRTQYHDLTAEEVALVYGVPFELIPFKANPTVATPPSRVHHVHAMTERADLEISFPRVDGYVTALRGRITVDWARVPPLVLDPQRIPDEVRNKGLADAYSGRLSLWGPGKATDAELTAWRATKRVQELGFEMAEALTRRFAAGPVTQLPVQVLFLQVLAGVRQFLRERVQTRGTTDVRDVFLSPYFGWAVETLAGAMAPATRSGPELEVPLYEAHRGPGSTADVDFWTAKPVWPVEHSHLNGVAAFYLDTSPHVRAFVKNDHLGFGIPYLRQGERHEYVPDFLVRLKQDCHDLGTLILEVKGGRDPFAAEKEAGARRWVAAVNRDRNERACGRWAYHMVRSPTDISTALAEAIGTLADPTETGASQALGVIPHPQPLLPEALPAQPRRLL